MAELGHWKTPKTLEEAKQITDTIIDNVDPEWLIGFGLELLGVPEATAWVQNDWVQKRRTTCPTSFSCSRLTSFSVWWCPRNCLGT